MNTGPPAPDLIDHHGVMPKPVVEIALMAEYVAWPIWGPKGPMAEDELPLSQALKDRIKAWFNVWDPGWSRPDWPVFEPPTKGHRTKRTKTPKGGSWNAEGRAIVEAMQEELGPRYRVVYANH